MLNYFKQITFRCYLVSTLLNPSTGLITFRGKTNATVIRHRAAAGFHGVGHPSPITFQETGGNHGMGNDHGNVQRDWNAGVDLCSTTNRKVSNLWPRSGESTGDGHNGRIGDEEGGLGSSR
jgi:hypothetical protein